MRNSLASTKKEFISVSSAALASGVKTVSRHRNTHPDVTGVPHDEQSDFDAQFALIGVRKIAKIGVTGSI